MPIFSGRCSSTLEQANGGRELSESLHEQMIAHEQRLRVIDSCLRAEQSGACRLQLDVIARAELRLVTLHQLHPPFELIADVDMHCGA